MTVKVKGTLPPLDRAVLERFRCDFKKGTKLCDGEDYAIILATLEAALRSRPSSVPDGVREARHRIALFISAYAGDDGDAPDTTLINQSRDGALLLLGDLRATLSALPAQGVADELCDGCPPIGYPTDKMRCLPCPRRNPAVVERETLERAAKAARRHVIWLLKGIDRGTRERIGNRVAERIIALSSTPGQPPLSTEQEAFNRAAAYLEFYASSDTVAIQNWAQDAAVRMRTVGVTWQPPIKQATPNR